MTPYLFLWVGFLLLLRRLGRSWAAAAYAATVVTFAGSALFRFLHLNMVAVLAHGPWFALATLAWMRSSNPRLRAACFAALVLMVASQALLGHPQMMVLLFLFEAAFLLVALSLDSDPEAPKRLGAPDQLRAAMAWGSTFLLGAALAAPQLLATVGSLGASIRSTTDLGFRLEGSLHPINLTTWFSPYALETGSYGFNRWEIAAYVGAATPLLLLTLFAVRRQLSWLEQRTALICVAVAGLGLWLALGKWGILGIAVSYLPLFDSFRMPARWMLIAHIALAFPIALAVDQLLERLARPDDAAETELSEGPQLRSWFRRMALLSIGFLFTVVFLRIAPAPAGWRPSFVEPLVTADWAAKYLNDGWSTLGGTLLTLLAVGSVAALATSRSGNTQRIGLAGLLLVLAVDVATQGLRLVRAQPTATAAELVLDSWTPTGTASSRLADGRLDAPADARYLLNRLSMRDWSSTHGYAGLIPERHLPLGHPATRRLLGVSYVLAEAPPEMTGVDRAQRESLQQWRATWSPHPGALPYARLVTRWTQGSGDDDLLAALNRADHDFETLAYVEDTPEGWPAELEKSANSTQSPSVPRKLALLSRAPGQVTVELTPATEQRSWLLISEGFHPDWTATVTSETDITTVAACRAWGDLIAVPLEPGARRIELEFTAKAYRRGLIPAATAAFLTLLVVVALPGRAWLDGVETI